MAMEYRINIACGFDTEVERDKAYTEFKEVLFGSVDRVIFKNLSITKAAFESVSIGNSETLTDLMTEKASKL